MEQTDKEAYLQNVDDNIRKFGFHMTFVFEGDTPSFCYSTGLNSSFDIPDIFISALPQNLSFELVDSYVEAYKESKILPLNTRLESLSDRFPVYLIEANNPSLQDYVLSSVRFYKGKDYKYVQLIFPDTKGNFPNDCGYDYDQEIMGDFVN